MRVDSRIAVLENRVERLEWHETEQDARLKGAEADNARMRTELVVLRMQVLIFAAIGASIGNQVVTAALNALVAWLAKGMH